MTEGMSDQEIINAALAARKQTFPPPVAPTAGVLPVKNLRSLENWRAFFHQLVAVIVPILVTADIVSKNAAAAWVPFVFAIADNILSVGNTTDKIRKAIYAAVGVAQAGGLATVVLSSVAPNYVTVGGAVLAVVSAFMARFYTPTTTLVSTAH